LPFAVIRGDGPASSGPGPHSRYSQPGFPRRPARHTFMTCQRETAADAVRARRRFRRLAAISGDSQQVRGPVLVRCRSTSRTHPAQVATAGNRLLRPLTCAFAVSDRWRTLTGCGQLADVLRTGVGVIGGSNEDQSGLGAAARVDLRHRRPATKFPRLACRETRIEAEPQPRCRAHDGQSPPPAPVAFPWRWIGAAAVRTGDPPCPACPPLVATPCKATRGRGPCIGAAS
jgi:hypothetical protein